HTPTHPHSFMPEIIDINTLFGPWPAAATDLAVDGLLASMKQHGINAACTLSTVGLLLDHNTGNSATKAACAESPALIPVATINPQSFFGGDGPHARFKADGFELVRLFPGVQGWHPFYAPFTAILKSLDPDAMPVMIDIDVPG